LRTFFLFYVLSYFLRSPLLALVVVGLLFYVAEARYQGRYFNPSSFFSKRNTIRELERTVTTNEHDVAAHNDLGRLLAEQGKYSQALPHLERAIQRMDDSAEANFYYGLCLIKTGQSADGERYVRRALELSPHFLYGDAELALSKYVLSQGRAEEALDHARKSVRINTSSVEGWLTVASSERALGNSAEARKAYQRAVEAYDDLPHYLRLAARKHRAEAKRELRSLR